MAQLVKVNKKDNNDIMDGNRKMGECYSLFKEQVSKFCPKYNNI
jgi:hypothetical protein